MLVKFQKKLQVKKENEVISDDYNILCGGKINLLKIPYQTKITAKRSTLGSLHPSKQQVSKSLQ